MTVPIGGSPFHHTVHLNEADLHPARGCCPWCESSERQEVLVLQEAPTVSLLRCAHCSACSASRMPTAAALASYYGSYYDDAKSEGAEQITFAGPRRMARHIARRLPHDPAGKRLRILDFGGGDGSIDLELARLLIGAGAEDVQIRVIDYSAPDEPVEEGCIHLIGERNLQADPGANFDIVIASAVLEHLPEPAGRLNELLAAMAPGGMFYARTPFLTGFARLVPLFGRRVDFNYPAHLHDLGQPFWDQILLTLGLQDDYRMIASKPSLVETGWRSSFPRTLAAYVFKAPWYVLDSRWSLVGGWEVFIERRRASTSE